MYDTIIIGGGAAGLSAAIYNGRYGHKTLVITGDGIDGSTIETWGVENYPGHISIDGPVLIQTMQTQAKNTGAELITAKIDQVSKIDDIFNVQYADKSASAETIIYAAGTIRRQLGLPNENKLKGKGVSYCATCDGPLFRNKIVGVVGGGDSAVKAAFILANYTQKVYIIAREEKFIAEPINIEKAEKNEKIEILYNTQINELLENDGKLAGLKLQNGKKVELAGIFIEIGGMANIDPIKPLGVELDEKGYIKVDCGGATNVPGFFAAGDVSDAFGGFKQIITAAAGGSVASYSAHNYLVKHH